MRRRNARTGFFAGLLAALGVAGILIGLGGFLSFVVLISDQSASPSGQNSDAIVVLTGGDARLDAGMALLSGNQGQRLLISGVNARVDRAEIRKLVDPVTYPEFDCCVDLDKIATNTIGNAVETARWASDHGYDRVIVVTANYHMPRAMAHMNRTAPQIVWVPYAVAPGDVHLRDWWRWPGSARLLISEYMKFLAMQTRFRLETI